LFFSFLFQHHGSDLRLPWLASIEVDLKASMDARPSFHSTLQHKITVALSGVAPTQQQGAVLGQVYGLGNRHLIITLQPPANLNDSQQLILETLFSFLSLKHGFSFFSPFLKRGMNPGWDNHHSLPDMSCACLALLGHMTRLIPT